MIVYFPSPERLRRRPWRRESVRLRGARSAEGDVGRLLRHRVLLRPTGTDRVTAPEEVLQALATVRKELQKGPQQVAVATNYLNPSLELLPGY